MPRVRLFNIHSNYVDDYNTLSRLDDPETPWEEISHEDLNYLKNNLSRFSVGYKQLVIVEDISATVPEIITSIKDLIEKDKKAEEQRKKLEQTRTKNWL